MDNSITQCKHFLYVLNIFVMVKYKSHTHIHTHSHTYKQAYLQPHAPICTFSHMLIQNANAHIHTVSYRHINSHTHKHTNTHTHTPTHTHKHTNTHTNLPTHTHTTIIAHGNKTLRQKDDSKMFINIVAKQEYIILLSDVVYL